MHLVESFILKDIYLIKDEMDVFEMANEEILSKALILRECIGTETNRVILYKSKKYDDNKNIVECIKYECNVESIDDAYELLTKIGFKECMRYEQECLAYALDDKQILIQYLPELGLFAEVENDKDEEELIKDLQCFKMAYYEDDYYVKKASLMLDKVKKQRRCEYGRKEY